MPRTPQQLRRRHQADPRPAARRAQDGDAPQPGRHRDHADLVQGDARSAIDRSVVEATWTCLRVRRGRARLLLLQRRRPGGARRLRRRGKLRGLKLYPGYQTFYPADAKWRPAYEFAARHKIPVMIHTGDTYTPKGKLKYAHPLNVDEAAVDFPETNFLICHIGNPWIRDCMEVVYKNANVYTDISGLVLGDFSDRFEKFMRKQLEEMLLFGVEPRNVLFGTDWPISSMESYLEFMRDLATPEREKRRILAENAIELYRLDPSTSMFSGRSA
ncbi:MAG: amidohydrolase family protein [Gemmatimonadales bacterium]